MKDWTLKTWAMDEDAADRVATLLQHDGYTVEKVHGEEHIMLFAKAAPCNKPAEGELA